MRFKFNPLTFEQKLALRRSAEDSINAMNPHWGDFRKAATAPHILSLLDSLDEMTTYRDNAVKKIMRLRERITELEQIQAKSQPISGEVLVTVSGFTGSGKSAVAGEIEIALSAIGLSVVWTNGDTEKRMTGADWLTALEMYKPRVRILEQNVVQTTNKNNGGNHE